MAPNNLLHVEMKCHYEAAQPSPLISYIHKDVYVTLHGHTSMPLGFDISNI